MNGHLQAPAALPPGKELSLNIIILRSSHCAIKS